MSKKRNNKKSMICFTPKLRQIFLFTLYKAKKNCLQKKSFLRKRVSGGLNKNQKDFLTALAMPIKKDPTTSIRKHANELKDHEKKMRIAIKQDLSPDLNPLDYAIRGVLEYKTNPTSHPNIGSLKTAIEEE